MKHLFALFVAGVMALSAAAQIPEQKVKVSDLTLTGEIEGENIVFTLAFTADVEDDDMRLPLVVGDVAYLDGEFPRRAELAREKDTYFLKFGRDGKDRITFRFASRAIKEGDWRHTSFSIPGASIRKISVLCDRNDLEVRFPGALDMNREQVKDPKARPGADKPVPMKTEVTAFLGISNQFEVRWKPEVKKLDAELVATCDANTLATAGVGVLRLDTIFTYRVIQGALTRLSFGLPDVNVTQVRGEDIQDWRVDKEGKKLLVTLSRPKEDVYRFQVESEMGVAKFPCKFNLPVLVPEGVLRTSGFLLIGTDSAIKLQVNRANGLTQVDQSAFPSVALAAGEGSGVKTGVSTVVPRTAPMRSTYAYQYANVPYTLDLGADDIVTASSVDGRLVLSLEDTDLSFKAALEVEVKDAPAREITIETDPDLAWTVTSIMGKNVSEADTDVREKDGRRVINIPFKRAVLGTTLVEIQMERTLPADTKAFRAPRFKVLDAKSERGYLVVASGKGIRLKTGAFSGLREVHTGSAPMKPAGAQHAFRYKDSGWDVGFTVERVLPSIHSEVFHLVSLSEGMMYCSAAITYHIGGAPAQDFKVRVPADVETLEFTGADIEGWTRKDDVCTVRLQTKILGDYTMLVTYDREFDALGADVPVAGIATMETESELGYVALASSASLSVMEAQPLPTTMFKIDRGELPPEYTAPVADPIIGAYKYVSVPHQAMIRVKPFKTEQLLGQVADYVKIRTDLSKDGESITTVNYYIKNASQQYLVVKLPAGANLWSIKYVDPNGRKERVLSQEKDGQYLIPVRRPRDPNTAIQVEVKYAQTHGKLNFWRGAVQGVSLLGPSLPAAHATFAGWEIAVPEKFAISELDGNMVASEASDRAGLTTVLLKVWRTLLAILPGFTLEDALMSDWGGPRTREVTRTVNLADEMPPQVLLFVVPNWMGTPSSARALLMGMLLGIGLMIYAGRRQSAVLRALSWTVLAFALAECAAGRTALALVLVLFLLWAFLFKGGAALIGRMLKTLFRRRPESGSSQPPPIRIKSPELSAAPAGEAGYPPPFEPMDAPPDPADGDSGPEKPNAGSARLWILPFVLALGLAATGLAEKPANPPAAPLMDFLQIDIEGPGTARDAERSARVTEVLKFRTEGPASFIVVPSTSVLKEYELGSRHLEITNRKEGYVLNVARSGEYTVTLKSQTPVAERDGQWAVAVYMLENMKNKVTLNLPEADMDVQSEEAVLFKLATRGKVTDAEAVFGPTRVASFRWSPRVRKTRLEEVLFFAEVNSYVALQSGMIDITHLVRYQIAQGEMKALKVRIPKEMTVTAVQAPGLATWSFDPETRLLDAFLERPVTGEFTLALKTQVSCDGLPYSATMGTVQVLDASRQRGSIAISAPDTIQVHIGETKGLNPMNIEDFSTAAIALASERKAMPGEGLAIRRSFRYQRPDEVSLAVETERVLPELRVVESGSLSIADERVVLATKLALTVAKSGIFSVELSIPGDFDVETLTGPDVSHWDDVGADGVVDNVPGAEKETGAAIPGPAMPRSAKLAALAVRPAAAKAAGNAGVEEARGDHSVVVHFNKQITASTEINLVVARMEKGVEERIVVPRVRIKDARKHTGRLSVSGEKGIRLMVADHTGVDIKKASEEGIRQAGVLVFDILRPTWTIELKTEVMAPVVKPEVLQWVDLTEGMLQCKSYIRYKIENAGVKTFLLQSPMKGATLSVLGSRIARVHEVDREKGVWQVDLHSKQENAYAMTVSYQMAYERAAEMVKILPLKTLETEGQRGYLVVTCGGRVEVKAQGDLAGLEIEDPRNIPATFGTGDLSNAIKCYRTVRPDYALELSVVRHDSASVLPASVDKMRLTSVLSPGGRLLTQVQIWLTVGDLRLLKVELPEGADRLWTALVNGKEVSTSKDRALYCIPLEGQASDRSAMVEFIYAGSAHTGLFGSRQEFAAPRIEGLPLQDVEWKFYVPPDRRYYGFGGTMDHPDLGTEETERFTASDYARNNRQMVAVSKEKAEEYLSIGNKLMQEGKQRQAQDAFANAYNLSQGQADLNEDARVQLRNLQKQQVKMGLVGRRGQLRQSKNIVENDQGGEWAPQPQQVSTAQSQQFTQEDVQRMEKRLSFKDNSALEVVADKIIDQQAAAAGVVSAIRIVMPAHGAQLLFKRSLQIDPNGDLTVRFWQRSGSLGRMAQTAWPAAVVFVLLWIVAARRTREA